MAPTAVPVMTRLIRVEPPSSTMMASAMALLLRVEGASRSLLSGAPHWPVPADRKRSVRTIRWLVRIHPPLSPDRRDRTDSQPDGRATAPRAAGPATARPAATPRSARGCPHRHPRAAGAGRPALQRPERIHADTRLRDRTSAPPR